MNNSADDLSFKGRVGMFFTEMSEVRALIALSLTGAMISAVFLGQLEAKELLLPFSTVLGFFFAGRDGARGRRTD